MHTKRARKWDSISIGDASRVVVVRATHPRLHREVCRQTIFRPHAPLFRQRHVDAARTVAVADDDAATLAACPLVTRYGFERVAQPHHIADTFDFNAQARRCARTRFGQIHQLVGRHRQSLREFVVAHPADHKQQLILL